MGDNENRKVYESRPVKDYRDLVDYSCTHYAENIAYKYKKDYTAKEPEYIEKTYKQTGEDIKALSTTLLKLGLENVTTNADKGGKGIGFITTFETMKQTGASLIIEEFNKSTNISYTKAIRIRFDNKNEYKICSYRANEIKSMDINKRIIIEQL